MSMVLRLRNPVVDQDCIPLKLKLGTDTLNLYHFRSYKLSSCIISIPSNSCNYEIGFPFSSAENMNISFLFLISSVKIIFLLCNVKKISSHKSTSSVFELNTVNTFPLTLIKSVKRAV